MPADLDHTPVVDPALSEKLHRWVAVSLISPAEADAIRAFEGRPRDPEPRTMPMIAEALAYVGAALAAAAAAVLLGDRWSELTSGGRVAFISVAFAVAFAAGASLRGRRRDPALGRLTSVLWAIATGLSGWLAWLVAHDVLDLRGSTPALWCGIAIAALGAGQYWVLREGLQQIAVFAGLLTIVGASVGRGAGLTLTVWGIGAMWVALGALDRLPPQQAAFIGGSLVVLWAPIALTDGGEGFGMWLGLATAIGLIVASLALHRTVLLGFGTVGVFAYLIRVLGQLYGDTAAMPVALLIAGAIVIGFAVSLARRSARRQP